MNNDYRLSRDEQINLATFSHEASVDVYKKEGLTGPETAIIQNHFTDRSLPLLDVGCGTGRTSEALGKMGFTVFGIDLSSAMIRKAHSKRPSMHCANMNACYLGFGPATFANALFSFNGIDYISPYGKRLECLREIHRVLKPGGILIYSSHNAVCIPKNRLGWGIIKETLFDGRLFSHYRKELEPQGALYSYYGIPYFEIKTLRSLGFNFLGIKGKKHSGMWNILFNEISPYYIAQKR